MITVNLKGGLGNQMFQYACGRALALKNDTGLSLIRSQSSSDIARPFSLTHFNIKAEVVSGRKSPFFLKLKEKLKQKITGNFHVGFDPKILRLGQTGYLDGYFQSELYFKDYEGSIREDFTLKEPLLGNKAVIADIIKNDPNAVSVHVRRGDYLTHPDFGGIATKEYYESAITEIQSHFPAARFYVFSDDIGWCQTELPSLKEAAFVSNSELEDFDEMHLMTLTKHHIIANSSFSWWGAWLGQNPTKIVIAPARWSNLHEDWYRDIIPEKWIRI